MSKTPVMRSRRTADGYVYVVSAPNGYVKIGMASNPFERFTMIQCNSPLPLTLAYVCECKNPVDVEVAVHSLLAAQRRHREWFEAPTAIAIDAIRETLKASGARLVQAPHRSEKKKPGACGAPPLLRPAVNEMAIAIA